LGNPDDQCSVALQKSEYICDRYVYEAAVIAQHAASLCVAEMLADNRQQNLMEFVILNSASAGDVCAFGMGMAIT
jgi:hypothetical protein